MGKSDARLSALIQYLLWFQGCAALAWAFNVAGTPRSFLGIMAASWFCWRAAKATQIQEGAEQEQAKQEQAEQEKADA